MTTLAETVNERLVTIKDTLVRRAHGEVVNPFIPTGLRDWDANGGLTRGILTVIGAATGEGKSIVKLQLARGAARTLHNVLMIDFEDPRSKTADRALSNLTGLDNKQIGLVNVGEHDVKRLDAAAKEISDWGSRIEHHVGLVDTAACLELMAGSGADLILVDYAQAFPENDGTTMERTIARFAWEANEMAQRKGIAVVVFSQVIREVETRGYAQYKAAKFRNPDSCDVSGFCPSGRNDVAWAKTLGERAKCLLYLWREGAQANRLGANVPDNKMRVISGKVNFGAETDIILRFDGPTATISDWKR